MSSKNYQSSTLFTVDNNFQGQSDYIYHFEKPRKRIIISRKQIKSYSLPTEQQLVKERTKKIRFSFNVDKATRIKTISNAQSTKKHFSPYETTVKPKKSTLATIPTPTKNKKQIFTNKTIQMHIQQEDLSNYIEQKIQKLKAYYQGTSDVRLIKIKKNRSKKLSHFICPLSRTTFTQ